MCQAFGINGKTAGAYQGEQTVDEARQVRVQFLATNAADMVWEFQPLADEVAVHPGAVSEMRFVAFNPTDKPMTAQAIPSVAPSQGRGLLPQDRMFLLYPAGAASRASASRCRCDSSSTATCLRMCAT